jgi:hypothetical protein
MNSHKRSLIYLEHAITVAAFGTDEGRDALLNPHASDDLVETAMRGIPQTMREDYVSAARPLTTCGDPEVEARARQIISFANPAHAHEDDELLAQEWEFLAGRPEERDS